jgi:sarcosine oxidase
LAKRGARVLGIDRFSPPHNLGSSHGDTRITRLAIGEGAHYTPFARRSHEIWREIEESTGTDLLTQCGELIISSDNRQAFTHVEGFFPNTIAAAIAHGIPHELIDSREVRRRYPTFNVRDDEFGYFEPEAGYIRPEACIGAQLTLAEKHGSEIHRNERVTEFGETSGRVTVKTDRHSYEADTVILAAGAWLPRFLDASRSSLFRVYRQVLNWFEVDGDPAVFGPSRFPVFIWELPDTRQGVYGFPVIDGCAMKIATERYERTTSPEDMVRAVLATDVEAMHREFIAPYFHGVSSRCARSVSCLYTVTPDAGFVIDRLPESDRVIVASCCSGHGFKHSAAIGEVLADMAQGRENAFDLAPFRWARFS